MPAWVGFLGGAIVFGLPVAAVSLWLARRWGMFDE